MEVKNDCSISSTTAVRSGQTEILLRNSFNTSLVLSLDDDNSLFENPTMSGLSFERGISMVGLFRYSAKTSLLLVIN